LEKLKIYGAAGPIEVEDLAGRGENGRTIEATIYPK